MYKHKIALTVLMGSLCMQPLSANYVVNKIKGLNYRPQSVRLITLGVVATALGAYYTLKKPGAIEPVKSNDSVSKKIMYALDSVLGDTGEDRKIVRVDLTTGNVIYEKKEPRRLGWLLKNFNKQVLPILVAGGILLKTKDDIYKIITSFFLIAPRGNGGTTTQQSVPQTTTNTLSSK